MVALVIGAGADVGAGRIGVVELRGDLVGGRPLAVIGGAAGEGEQSLEPAFRIGRAHGQLAGQSEQLARGQALAAGAQPVGRIPEQPDRREEGPAREPFGGPVSRFEHRLFSSGAAGAEEKGKIVLWALGVAAVEHTPSSVMVFPEPARRRTASSAPRRCAPRRPAGARRQRGPSTRPEASLAKASRAWPPR